MKQLQVKVKEDKPPSVFEKKSEKRFLSFVDALAGRLASETVVLNEIFSRMNQTKKEIFERTKAYSKLISSRKASLLHLANNSDDKISSSTNIDTPSSRPKIIENIINT